MLIRLDWKHLCSVVKPSFDPCRSPARPRIRVEDLWAAQGWFSPEETGRAVRVMILDFSNAFKQNTTCAAQQWDINMQVDAHLWPRLPTTLTGLAQHVEAAEQHVRHHSEMHWGTAEGRGGGQTAFCSQSCTYRSFSDDSAIVGSVECGGKCCGAVCISTSQGVVDDISDAKNRSHASQHQGTRGGHCGRISEPPHNKHRWPLPERSDSPLFFLSGDLDSWHIRHWKR